MITVNARQARQKLSELLSEAERGNTVTMTRRGQVVAQLVPPPAEAGGPLPDLEDFRASIVREGQAPSAEKLVRGLRDEGRF